MGELALGRNVLVAFMPWNGYNFEDSILISERIVRDDVFTSIHIEEFETMARDTKLGPEEITRDIPNVGEEALKNLDEAGIVYIGAEVNPGDILVGKITPKGESPDDAGRKSCSARSSAKRPPTCATQACVCRRVPRARSLKCACSTVTASKKTNARSRSNAKKSNVTPRTATTNSRSSNATSMPVLRSCLLHKQIANGPKGIAPDSESHAVDARDVDEGAMVATRAAATKRRRAKLKSLRKLYDDAKNRLEARFADKVDKLRRGDELPPGVMKMVKVFVAVKRKLQPGDKMAGRHGNKGVISKIVPIEDMAAPRRRYERSISC